MTSFLADNSGDFMPYVRFPHAEDGWVRETMAGGCDGNQIKFIIQDDYGGTDPETKCGRMAELLDKSGSHGAWLVMTDFAGDTCRKGENVRGRELVSRVWQHNFYQDKSQFYW